MVLDVSRYLSQKEAETPDPEMAKEWSKLDELYTRRLWHQLTVKLLEFCRRPQLQQKGTELIELYDNFIKDIEMRIHPLSYMEISVMIIKQMEPNQALEFLDKSEPKLKGSKEAQALCILTRGEVQLLKKKDVHGAQTSLEAVDGILQSMDGITSVHGRYYLLESELYRQLYKTADYYRSALKFLGCTNINSLSFEEQRVHAERLAIAAIVGDGIYNFGELLAHPILNSLKRSSKGWLIDLMKAFNTGNMKEYKTLEPHFKTIPDLEKNKKALHTKVILLCLMECQPVSLRKIICHYMSMSTVKMTFHRPSFERQLTFQEIMDKTDMSQNDVELYVMKAIAKGLVKGRIDQVGEKVYMTWVQPRVLDPTQVGGMISRLETWQAMIGRVDEVMQKNAADILLT